MSSLTLMKSGDSKKTTAYPIRGDEIGTLSQEIQNKLSALSGNSSLALRYFQALRDSNPGVPAHSVPASAQATAMSGVNEYRTRLESIIQQIITWN